MIYAIGDLHGRYDLYKKMLDKIEFGAKDTLYLLGDIVDRGPDGIKILLDLMKRKNVYVIRGNHDVCALSLLGRLATNPEIVKTEKFADWYQDGGEATYTAFEKLSDEDKKRILAYMDSFLIYEEITLNGNTFFMAHTVPEKARMLEFEKLLWEEFIVGEPDYEKVYFNEKYIVTGHTPTAFIDYRSKGKIWRQNNHIAIDCGAVFLGRLGCICLDTQEEFYVEQD